MLAVLFVIEPIAVQGQKKFLGDFDQTALQKLSSTAFESDVLNAIGCSGEASPQKIAAIKKTLQPIWKTLPKISGDRIERRLLRYVAHRYFMQTSSLVVRGFEPNRLVNESHWGNADILSQSVPAYVEAILHANHEQNIGFSLTDATQMILMLDQLIVDSESTLLEKNYKRWKMTTDKVLTWKQLTRILRDYMVEWIVEGDEEDMEMLFANRTMIKEVLPNYYMLMFLAHGSSKTLQYARRQNIPRGSASNTWNMQYTFEDAHAIVGDMTQKFHHFWKDECDSMKNALVDLDPYHTGRVPLAKLYNRAMNADWRFGESEAYLRDMGALDESSSYLGAQVIIPNYMQAVSNCIVSTPHYLVCCKDDCEEILGEIEVRLQTPTASTNDILDIVGNMTIDASLDEEYTPQLEGRLTKLLEEIATASGGMIPLHGRLFAQWLHYAFPRECPFPHKLGVVTTITPSQYGEDFVASEAEMVRHTENEVNVTSINVTVSKDDLHWMSQWSDDEELMVDYSAELGTSWLHRVFLAIVGLALLACGICVGTVTVDRTPAAKVRDERFYV